MPPSITSPDANFFGGAMNESLGKNGDFSQSTSDYNPLLNRQLENPTS